jgi:ribosomal protein S18 acetylase RimI-like enzyme
VARTAARVRLGVTLGDTPAVRLYQHAGFVPVGEARVIREEPRLEGQELVLDLRKHRQ